MSERLRLPEIFKGTWDNLLIVTYGADLPFFENAILRSDFTCRNKIILGDGRKFLKSCERYAQDGKVRLLNQNYIADGIHVPNAAHAKIILLTKNDEGKLLIGSGNLGIQGYTSGGEMFTFYHYHPKQTDTLAAFQTVWKFVKILMERGAVGGAALPYLQRIYEDTPWLMQTSTEESRPVRHNLEVSFLDQLKQEVGGEKVQELWVMAPFYDENVVALSSMIDVFDPNQVNLVFQPHFVSVDKSALQKVITKNRGRIFIYPFDNFSDSDSAYVHTKLYLLKTKKRAICLQGSSNCSQVAMLFPSPQGNIEISNLLKGNRDTFDDLLAPLALQPPLTSLKSLELEYQKPERVELDNKTQWLLTGARWHEDSIFFFFHGDFPKLSHAKVIIDEITFTVPMKFIEDGIAEVRLTDKAQEVLSAGILPVWLEIDGQRSSPVFPCNVDALAKEAQEISHAGLTRKIENFDPEDPEFEDLLRELDASLPIDRQSIWQLAGRTPPTLDNEDDDTAQRLAYADINYELLRQHPKIQQYLRDRGKGAGGVGPTRLQEILSAITSHFQGLVDVAYKKPIAITKPSGEEVDGEETEQESDGSEETPQKKPVNRKRVKGILKHFIRRYLRGIQSKDFLELIGPDVIVNNYVIFSHILWRLFQKDWVEADFIIETYLKMWRFFWGGERHKGYLSALEADQRIEAHEILREQKSDSLVIAALFYGDNECAYSGRLNLRLELRDSWRYLLEQQPFPFTVELLLDAWVYLHEVLPYSLPTPSSIAASLNILSRVDTTMDFLRDLEKHFHLPENSCRLVRQSIFRESTNQTIETDCLEVMASSAITSMDDAKAILFAWMRYGQREFFRISTDRYILIYDTVSREGVFHDRETKKSQPIADLSLPSSEKWQTAIFKIIATAKKADQSISLRLEEVKEPVKVSEK